MANFEFVCPCAMREREGVPCCHLIAVYSPWCDKTEDLLALCAKRWCNKSKIDGLEIS